jgi:hypothetical protein
MKFRPFLTLIEMTLKKSKKGHFFENVPKSGPKPEIENAILLLFFLTPKKRPKTPPVKFRTPQTLFFYYSFLDPIKKSYATIGLFLSEKGPFWALFGPF